MHNAFFMWCISFVPRKKCNIINLSYYSLVKKSQRKFLNMLSPSGCRNPEKYPRHIHMSVMVFLHLWQHLFASESRDQLLKTAMEFAGNYVGVTLRIRKEAISFEQFVHNRLGKYRYKINSSSKKEFHVQCIKWFSNVLVPSICSSFVVQYILYLISCL